MQGFQRAALAALLAAGLAAGPAAAGGLTEPPDGIGNPSANDYTGFRVAYLVLGLLNSPANYPLVSCVNVGGIATQVSFQVWADDGPPARPPVFDSSTNLAVGDTDPLAATGSGALPFAGVGRILVREPRAAVVCHARLLDVPTGHETIELPVIPVGKPPALAPR